jgi:hypothetical protein
MRMISEITGVRVPDLNVPDRIGSWVKIQSDDPTARRHFKWHGFVVEYTTSTGHHIMRRDVTGEDAAHNAKPPPTFSFEVC